MRKYIIGFVSVLFFVALTLSSCQSANDSFVGVDLSKLQNDMLAADNSLPEMTTVTNKTENAAENFAYLSDVDYKKIEGYFLSYSTFGNADEIVVVRVKNQNDVNQMKTSLEEHIQGRILLYDSYKPEQAQRSRNFLLFVNGRDIVLIVSDNSQNVKSAYLKNQTDSN